MSNHRETVSVTGAAKAAGPYSHAVKSNGLLFVSGQVHLDPESNTLVGDPPARTTIGVAALPMGAEVEMDAIVAL